MDNGPKNGAREEALNVGKRARTYETDKGRKFWKLRLTTLLKCGTEFTYHDFSMNISGQNPQASSISNL